MAGVHGQVMSRRDVVCHQTPNRCGGDGRGVWRTKVRHPWMALHLSDHLQCILGIKTLSGIVKCRGGRYLSPHLKGSNFLIKDVNFRCPDPPRDTKLSGSGTRDLVRVRVIDWRRHVLYLHTTIHGMNMNVMQRRVNGRSLNGMTRDSIECTAQIGKVGTYI